MAIETNLSGSPYFDDFDDSKKYAKILFKPGTAVQVRELNQLQTQIQDQIEKFGDHIYQRGTIISGCQPTFIPALDFAKLTDVTENQSAVDLPAYRNLFVENSSGVKAAIVYTESGYESTDPDLNTLYLKYIQSGNDGVTTKFSSGQSLKIFGNNRPIEAININSGGASSGFANNDTLVIISALILANSTGGQDFATSVSVGETITQTTTGAQAVITAVNTSLYDDKLVIEIEPLASEVIIGNTASWSFEESQLDDYLITSSGSSITVSNPAYVSGFVGAGATGYIRTNTTGQISEVVVSSGGNNYEIAPHVTVSSTRTPGPTTLQVNNLSLSAQNYRAGVTVSSLTGSIGTAYAMEITEGLIYQKGFMLNVDSQFVIVEKYNSSPDAVQVGFVTVESIANSSIDTSLNDNAAGFENFAAPGANRLKLNPVLTTKGDAAATEDPNFLGVWRFRNGKLSVTKETTQYSTIGDEMAKRTYQESGNFHVEGFKASTHSADAISNTDTEFSYVFSKGEAYIQGYRVTLPGGATIKANKATTTETETDNDSQFDYGSYVDVTELAGDFDFTQGAQISLGDTPADAISDHSGDITTAVSTVTEVGKARIRAVVHDRTKGPQGQANTRHKAYLFDIKMNQGKSFFDVRSIYEGTNAVADILPQTAAGSQGQLGAVLKQPNKVSQIVSTGQPLSSVSNVVYDFRHRESTTASTAGVITLTNTTNATFPYGTTSLLTNEQEDDIILVPEEDVISTTALTGTVSGTGTTLTGTTTVFESELQAGDYFEAGGSVYRVVSVENNTSLTYSPSATITGGTSAYRAFKQNVPVPMGARADINASSTSTSLTINLPVTLGATKNFSIITKQRNSGSVTKGVTRGAFAYIEANTHFNGTEGPWCLGHSDVIRLRGVYAGPNTSSTDITDNFIIEQNHNDQYYGLSQLKLKSTSNYTLGADDELLVKFDVLTTSTVNGAGVKTISSYTIDDEKELGALTTANTAINTLEIPEFRSKSDVYYDLRECLDFRPKSANTVAIETDETLAATNAKNPKVYGPTANATHAIETSRFSTQLRYPSPGAYLSYDKTYYQSRKDNVVVKTNGDIKVFEGGLNTSDPSEFLIYNVKVAAYPSYPENLSTDMSILGDLKVLKDFDTSLKRINRYTTRMRTAEGLTNRYTMTDISELEKRVKRLERLVTLDKREKKVKDLNIPSSIDPTIERFKFGYFVDAFFTSQFTELNSEENTASFYSGRLMPKRRSVNVPLTIAETTTAKLKGKRVQFPYSNYLLTSQQNVTDTPVPQEPAPVTIGTAARWIWDRGDYVRTNSVFAWTNKTDTGSNEFWHLGTGLPGTKVTNTSPIAPYHQVVFKFSSEAESASQNVVFNFQLFGGYDRPIFFKSATGRLEDAYFVTSCKREGLAGRISNLTADERRVIANEVSKITPSRDASSGPSSLVSPEKWITGANFSHLSNYYFIRNVGKMEIPHDPEYPWLHVVNFKASPMYSYYITGPSDVATLRSIGEYNYPGRTASAPNRGLTPTILTNLASNIAPGSLDASSTSTVNPGTTPTVQTSGSTGTSIPTTTVEIGTAITPINSPDTAILPPDIEPTVTTTTQPSVTVTAEPPATVSSSPTVDTNLYLTAPDNTSTQTITNRDGGATVLDIAGSVPSIRTFNQLH